MSITNCPHPLRFLFLLLPLAGIGFVGCNGAPESDAYGNFEATELTVSAQTVGRLLDLRIEEGDRLAAGEVVGTVDTTQLVFRRQALLAQRAGLLAQRQATLAQTDEVNAQANVLRTQLATATTEYERTRRLFEAEAATARELNQREGDVAALRDQIELTLARNATIRQQAASLAAQADQLTAQLREIDRQLQDARLTNPEAGTVLTLLARRGEVVAPGSPLYTLADLDTLKLRAYVTGAQLPRLRLGETVDVVIDDGAGGLTTRSGTITWISSDAEFTPNVIQTRDERADLVYAFNVRVPNPDGHLKIGMPGEVRFPEEADE